MLNRCRTPGFHPDRAPVQPGPFRADSINYNPWHCTLSVFLTMEGGNCLLDGKLLDGFQSLLHSTQDPITSSRKGWFMILHLGSLDFDFFVYKIKGLDIDFWHMLQFKEIAIKYVVSAGQAPAPAWWKSEDAILFSRCFVLWRQPVILCFYQQGFLFESSSWCSSIKRWQKEMKIFLLGLSWKPGSKMCVLYDQPCI